MLLFIFQGSFRVGRIHFVLVLPRVRDYEAGAAAAAGAAGGGAGGRGLRRGGAPALARRRGRRRTRRRKGPGVQDAG